MKPTALRSRAYVAGRIRNGLKNEKGWPQATDRWIFTSPEKDLIDQLAAHYEGTVEAWDEPKASPPNQWRLVTSTNRIHVWLPIDALITQFEYWRGRVCERRCDLEQCWFVGAGGEKSRIDCVCGGEEGSALCDAKSRLHVMLPEASMAGVWRFDSTSWNFAEEAPAMIDTIHRLTAAQRITRVDLVLTKRTGVTWVKGKQTKSEYIVPTIQIVETPEQLLVGGAGVGPGLGRGTLLELDRVYTEPVVHDPVFHSAIDDDEVVDAEIVEETAVVLPFHMKDSVEGWDEPPPGVSVMLNPRRNEEGQPRYVRKV